jgi:dolichol kinase
MINAPFVVMLFFWLFPAPIIAWFLWESGYSLNSIFLGVLALSFVDTFVSLIGAYFMKSDEKSTLKTKTLTLAGPSVVVFVVTLVMYIGLHLYQDALFFLGKG